MRGCLRGLRREVHEPRPGGRDHGDWRPVRRRRRVRGYECRVSGLVRSSVGFESWSGGEVGGSGFVACVDETVVERVGGNGVVGIVGSVKGCRVVEPEDALVFVAETVVVGWVGVGGVVPVQGLRNRWVTGVR